jgi:uncharacterized membrane protein YeaQ/YmgE (transglycosylase-associated protein family)
VENRAMLGTNILVVGLVAGWLASKIVFGTGLGIIGDIIVGIIGAFIGRWLFGQFHVDRWLSAHLHVHMGFWVDAIFSATVGAIVLLLVVKLIRRV